MQSKQGRWVVEVPRVVENRLVIIYLKTTVKDGANAFAQAKAQYGSRWHCLWDNAEVVFMD